ncbi:MAG: hypothetical protein JXD22_11545 [Sedimentisphaerales bacterium]|nr:hypothetical protein [Sedimentisphaerales bacterium]
MNELSALVREMDEIREAHDNLGNRERAIHNKLQKARDNLGNRERIIIKKLQKAIESTPSQRETRILIQAVLGNLTQTEMAERHNMSQSAISRLVQKFIPNLIEWLRKSDARAKEILFHDFYSEHNGHK